MLVRRNDSLSASQSFSPLRSNNTKPTTTTTAATKESFTRSSQAGGVAAGCSTISSVNNDNCEDDDFATQDDEEQQQQHQQQHASPEPRKLVQHIEFQEEAEQQQQQQHVNNDDDDLLQPSLHYIRYAQELAERKHGSPAALAEKKKRGMSSHSHSKSKSKSNSPPAPPAASSSSSTPRVAIPTAGSGGTLYVGTHSAAKEQRKVAAVFGGHKDRLSYLPGKLTHEVRKISEAQEQRVGGVIASRMFPFSRNSTASSSSLSRQTSKATANGDQQKHHHHHHHHHRRHHGTSEASASPPPKNFVSTSAPRQHAPVPHFASAFDQHSSPSPARTQGGSSSVLSPGSMYSVPYSDESVPPMSRVGTKPAAVAGGAATSPAGSSANDSRSPSSARHHHNHQQQQQQQQQQDFTHLNHLLSPGRAQLLESMEKAEWKSGGGEGSDLFSGTFSGTATFSRRLSLGATVHPTNNNVSMSMDATFGSGTLGSFNFGSGTMRGGGGDPRSIVSKQLAARYVAFFHQQLGTSGLDQPAASSSSSVPRGASPSDRGASTTTRSSSLLQQYSPGDGRGGSTARLTKFDELSLEDKDAVMQEWLCPSLMRRLILDAPDGLIWLQQYSES